MGQAFLWLKSDSRVTPGSTTLLSAWAWSSAIFPSPVRGGFISAQRYGYCINSSGAGDGFWGSAHSKSSPTIARRALCVVTKSPIEPHSPLIRNNKFKTAANDRRAKAPSDEPGIACSSLRLVAFKICWYTFSLMASSVIIFSLQKGKVLHDEAA